MAELELLYGGEIWFTDVKETYEELIESEEM